MDNQTKLSQEELDQINSLRGLTQQLQSAFGQVEFQAQVLELRKDKLVEQLESLQQQEAELGQQLTEKYGNGTIDLENGVFTKVSEES